MSAPLTVDATRCPLCGAGNGCAMEAQHRTGIDPPRCWCQEASFPDALLSRVPAAARGQACICARCAASHALNDNQNQNPEPATPCPP